MPTRVGHARSHSLMDTHTHTNTHTHTHTHTFHARLGVMFANDRATHNARVLQSKRHRVRARPRCGSSRSALRQAQVAFLCQPRSSRLMQRQGTPCPRRQSTTCSPLGAWGTWPTSSRWARRARTFSATGFDHSTARRQQTLAPPSGTLLSLQQARCLDTALRSVTISLDFNLCVFLKHLNFGFDVFDFSSVASGKF
jgi:hypothetical protein